MKEVKLNILLKNKSVKFNLKRTYKINKKYEITKPFRPSIKLVPFTNIIKQKEVNRQLIIKFCK